MYNVYNSHKGCHIIMPRAYSLDEVYDLAMAAANLGNDALYRVFEVKGEGQQFVTAWSVLDGLLSEHRDVTIPVAHW